MGRFVSIAAARAADGLRMACVRKIPSPWQEAAKGIFHVKGLDCLYAAQTAEDVEEAIADWAGDSSIPVVAYRDEKLRTGWAEILILAERLAPEPRLIPVDAGQRARMFGLAHEICGEMGIGWCMRLLMLRAGAEQSGPALPPEPAARLGAKYGFNPEQVARAEDRVIAVLGVLDGVLAEGEYFLDGRLSALDIYWATMANLLTPLPEAELPMSGFMRNIYATTNDNILRALTPALRSHQTRIYRSHLELPVPM